MPTDICRLELMIAALSAEVRAIRTVDIPRAIKARQVDPEMSLDDIAAYLCVSRTTINRYRQRADFPKPSKELPLRWAAGDIKRWRPKR